jgi:general L-amino acid transport system substrate-binding protein
MNKHIKISVNHSFLTVRKVVLLFLPWVFCAVASQVTAATLDNVKARGAVNCGVNVGLKGFAQTNSLGDYSGLDADFCRAVASAVFNNPDAVNFVPLSSGKRFDAIKSRAIDVLSRNTTWTMSRNTSYGEFVGVNYYDGQGFMVSKRSGIRSALELDNKKICIERATTTELNAIDYFNVSEMRYRPLYFTSVAEKTDAYLDGECTAITSDRSALAAIRASFPVPEAYLILPEVISKEPLGPMVPAGDSDWANIVRWSLNCMINAEEQGISSSNVSQVKTNANPAAARLLGLEGEFGEMLGISNTWCANIIGHIGNYAESYERNIGLATTVGLARGVNSLWTDGGLLYAPPIR